MAGETIAPTTQLANRKAFQELQLFKMKKEWQREKQEEVMKERDFLKEQLAAGRSTLIFRDRYCLVFIDTTTLIDAPF